MTARRDSSDGPGVASFGGRALLIGAVVFAAAATGLLVLTDQEKWLRLGIVAALWAALAGAFLAARYRRQVTDQREAAAERQQIYELELEREIAARREHELMVETEAKRKAEETSRDDIAALRGELQNMQQTLESLLGGEFLVERYALRAESTRMRSLGEDRSLAMHRDVKHLPAAAANSGNMVIPPVVREGETELIERVREVHQKPRREQQSLRPEPRVPDSRPPRGPARPERPSPEPVKPTARPEPPPRPEPARPAPRPEQSGTFAPHPAEVSDRWFVPDGLAEPTPQPPRHSEQPRRQEPQRPTDPAPRRAPTPGWDDGEQEWGPSWEKKPPSPGRRPEPARAQDPATAGHDTGTHLNMAERTGSWLAQYNKPAPSEPMYGSRAYVPQPQAHSQPLPTPPQQPSQPMPLPQPSQPMQLPSQPMQLPSQPMPLPQQQSQPLPQPKTPSLRMPENPSLRNVWAEGQNARQAPPEETGGGRRRRAEGQPSWQETVGKRAEEPGGGSHTSGRSVSELLANHGHDTSPRRRRRRED
jgi:hypothetical protein